MMEIKHMGITLSGYRKLEKEVEDQMNRAKSSGISERYNMKKIKIWEKEWKEKHTNQSSDQ